MTRQGDMFANDIIVLSQSKPDVITSHLEFIIMRSIGLTATSSCLETFKIV
jgi:hypothetical protein